MSKDLFAETSEERKAASAAFNALPIEVRLTCAELDMHHRLRDLIEERERAVRSHRGHLDKIDEQIRAIKSNIKRTHRERSTGQ